MSNLAVAREGGKQGGEAPFTTLELVEEYAEILELSKQVRRHCVPGTNLLEFELDAWSTMCTKLEEAYERETVHGGLVAAGRLAKETGEKAAERKDPSDGKQNNCGVWPVNRPQEGKLPTLGDLRAEESGTAVQELVVPKSLTDLLTGISNPNLSLTPEVRHYLRYILLHLRQQKARIRKVEWYQTGGVQGDDDAS